MNIASLIKRIFSFLNLEVKRNQDFEAIVLKDLLQDSTTLTIFDVGAFVGEKTLYYKRLFPLSKIYCFEPFPESYDKLIKNTSNTPSIFLENMAVSDQTRSVEFSIKNNFDQGNSLLQSSNEEYGEIAKDILRETKRIVVNSITLDDYILKNKIKKIHLLKLDIQGAELMALKGAQKALEQNAIDYIYLETQFIKMYNDQALFHELYSYLHDYNFRLYNFFGGTSHGYQLREANVLFYNKNFIK